MREEWRLFWLCNAVFWLPFFAMMLSANHDIRWIQAVLGADGMASMEQMYGGKEEQLSHLRSEYGSNFMMFCFYIYNNVAIDFRIFAGGMAAGVGTLFFLLFNGLQHRRGGGLREPRVQSGIVLVVRRRAFVVRVVRHGGFRHGGHAARAGDPAARPAAARAGAGGGVEGSAAADLRRGADDHAGGGGGGVLVGAGDSRRSGNTPWGSSAGFCTSLISPWQEGGPAMRLDTVTAEIRPRSDWEAVDLGLRDGAAGFLALLHGVVAGARDSHGHRRGAVMGSSAAGC